MHKTFLLIGGAFALMAIILGAFGAHALKTKLSAEQLQTFETGVKYQIYHALAILLLVAISPQFSVHKGIFLLFIAGVVLFSGSIYLLATRDLIGIHNHRWLGPLTPIGGLCFILGWAWFMVSILKK
ncbi:MAG: hypothetical protein RIQ89_1928 [Bacteroidota bacterium]|jgi:uncharacterized membrane protein YgdD (TMEM256/DUF423 family)